LPEGISNLNPEYQFLPSSVLYDVSNPENLLASKLISWLIEVIHLAYWTMPVLSVPIHPPKRIE